MTGVFSLVAESSLLFFLSSMFLYLSRRLLKGILIFQIIVSAIASYYMTFFNVVIGYSVVASVFTVDPELSMEAVGYKMALWVLVFGIIPSWIVCRYPLEIQTRRAVIRAWPVTVSIVFLSVVVTGLNVKMVQLINASKSAEQNLYIPSPGGVIAHAYLPSNWIVGTALFVRQQMGENDSAQLKNPVEQYQYDDSGVVDDLAVVFVLGETTRSDNVGLFGYGRNTTPQLSEEENLISVQGRACDTATLLSMRCMFVPEGGAADDEERTLHSRNVFLRA